MSYPKAIVEKAKCMQHLLLRVEAGESLDQVCVDLKVQLSASGLAKLFAKYFAGGRKFEALIDGRCGHPQKAQKALREWLYTRKAAHPQLAAHQLAKEVADQFDVKLSLFSTPVKILFKFAGFWVNFTVIFEIQTTDMCDEIVTQR